MNKIAYILLAFLISGCSVNTPKKSPNSDKLEFDDIDSSILMRSDAQTPFLFLCECKK